MKKLLLLSTILFLSACKCKQSHIRVVDVDKSYDPKLNCMQIEYERGEQGLHLASLERRYSEMLAYTDSPLCVHSSAQKFVQAIEASRSRIAKLDFLYEFKHCNKVSTPASDDEKNSDAVDLAN